MPKIEYEGDKDRILSTRGVGETMNEVMRRRYSRRGAIAAAAMTGAAMTVGVRAQTPDASPAASPAVQPEATVVGSWGSPVDEPTLSFDSIGLKITENVVVPEGCTAVLFLRWGEPITADAPKFDVHNQTAAAQAVQAGYNCDYIGWISLPLGSDASDNGLLVVNHEYTNPEIMFPGYITDNPDYDPADETSSPFVVNTSKDIVDIELEAHGLSVIEVRNTDGQWEIVRDSPYNRRITGHIIEMTEANNDHASTTFTWEIFMLAGDPEDEITYFAGFPKEQVSAIASPDNITFDTVGNIWISTDGLPNSFEDYDGLFATPTEGSERGFLRQFFSTVEGAECSGPVFNPDGTALFASIQHPGEGGVFEEPTTTWPDFDGVAKPSVVLITRDDGGVIGQ